MSIKVFIVEDEILHLEALKIAVEEAGLELVGECMDADSAFDRIKKQKPEVLLVDIALPGINNGITLAARVRDELAIPHIFTTSFAGDEIIEQAVTTKPAGYLHKPVDPVNLKVTVKMACKKDPAEEIKAPGNENITCVYVKTGDRLLRVDFNDVLIVRADGDNCIALVTEKKEYISRTTLKEFCRQLPPCFIQTHRSYFINLDHLDSFQERHQTACLKGHCAPVARNFRKAFLETIMKI